MVRLALPLDWETMDKDDFVIAVGEAAQDAVWKTPHPFTHRLAEDDPRREKYLREYQLTVGRQLLEAIEDLHRRFGRCREAPRDGRFERRWD